MTRSDLFTDALLSPSSALPPSAQLFSPLIGSWDLVVRWFDESGSVVREEAGEWHFAWVLEGRAVQDVWIVPPRGHRTSDAYEYGTSIRFHDAERDLWHSNWIGPIQGMNRRFTATAEGGTIVLRTADGDGPALRWTFEDMTADAFTWTNRVEADGEWRVQQTFAARRRPAQVKETG